MLHQQHGQPAVLRVSQRQLQTFLSVVCYRLLAVLHQQHGQPAVLRVSQRQLQTFLSVVCYRLLAMLNSNRCCATSISDVFVRCVLQVTGCVTSTARSTRCVTRFATSTSDEPSCASCCVDASGDGPLPPSTAWCCPLSTSPTSFLADDVTDSVRHTLV